MEENKNNFTELKQNQTVDIVQAQILNEMRETKRHVTFLSKMAIAILVALIPGFIYFAYMLILMMI